MSDLPATVQGLIRRLSEQALQLEDLSPEQLQIVAQWYELERHAAEIGRRVALEKIDLVKEVEAFFTRTLSRSTIRAYRAALAKLLVWCAGRSIHPLQMTPGQADEYAQDLKTSSTSNASVRLVISGASTFYTWIERRHSWLTNPFRGTRERPAKASSKALVIPTDQEIHVILKVLSEARQDVDAAFIAVLCFRGLRVSGAAQIRLRATDFKTLSKGRELQGELPPQAIEYLHKAGLRSGPVFKDRTTEGWRNRVSYLMRNLRDRGLIKAAYSAHDFRHYYALTQYRSDHDIHRLCHLLGHTSITVTEEYLRGRNLI